MTSLLICCLDQGLNHVLWAVIDTFEFCSTLLWFLHQSLRFDFLAAQIHIADVVTFINAWCAKKWVISCLPLTPGLVIRRGS